MKENFFGYWLYLADGLNDYYTLDTCPTWVTNSRVVALAFINPSDFNGQTISTVNSVIPLNYIDATNHFHTE